MSSQNTVRDTRDEALRMTVVIVNDNARVTGGADKVALTSAVRLARRGHRVYLLTAVGSLSAEEAATPGLTVLSTGQYDLMSDPNRLRIATQGLWNFKSERLAAALFDSLDRANTVVHVHLWAKALSSSVVRAALERDFQVVLTLHDYLVACPTGTFFLHGEQTICKLKPMGARCLLTQCDARSYADKMWRVARQLMQEHRGGMPGRLQHFISISDLSVAVMRDSLPETAALHRVSNFVDMPWRPPAPVRSHTNFVYSGRLVAEKGPTLFAHAAALEGVPAVFLGEGECRAEVLAANRDARISGWLPYEETQRRLREARAFVFPSLWYEAQPLVVLEALANGVPCVVPDTSAAREMVVDGETGLWFRGGDLADLREKLRRLKDPYLAGKLGEAAHSRYWQSPQTVERHVQQLEEVYRSMLAETPGPESRIADLRTAESRSVALPYGDAR